MKWSRFLKFAVAVAVAGLMMHAASVQAGEPAKKSTPTKAEPKTETKTAAKAERVVKLQVTENGFEPSPIKLTKDEPVALMVTRKTDKTCATELVMKDYGIKTELPLDQEVAIRFTPTKSGTLKYGCGMGQMISGQFLVE